jgi:hypothetical protein
LAVKDLASDLAFKDLVVLVRYFEEVREKEWKEAKDGGSMEDPKAYCAQVKPASDTAAPATSFVLTGCICDQKGKTTLTYPPSQSTIHPHSPQKCRLCPFEASSIRTTTRCESKKNLLSNLMRLLILSLRHLILPRRLCPKNHSSANPLKKKEKRFSMQTHSPN